MDKNTFTDKILEAETTLYHIAKTFFINDKDCEDAVQNGILKAYEKLDSLKDERFFKTWLVRILINECYYMKRWEKPTVPYEESLKNEIIYSEHNYSELYQAIQELPPRIRITIVLYYVEGYSVNEIKDILKIPGGTVKSRLSKGRKLLKIKLESEVMAYE
ncbi:MAG: RNA polymerase sigma factor [Clostridiales bacterium]